MLYIGYKNATRAFTVRRCIASLTMTYKVIGRAAK